MASRMSLPTRAERAAQAYPPPMAQAPASTEMTAMVTPSWTMAAKEEPEVPWLSISATRVGMKSAPATSTISRKMVSAHSFRWGLRKRRMSFMGKGLLSERDSIYK